jgi:DNA-binding PadR family transcriptional regulator
MIGISDSEAVILGMLVDAPKYAYEMEGIIEAQSMRDWTEIAFSSIYYVLTNLEKKKFVISATQSEKNRTRKIYTITPEGLAELKEKVRERISIAKPIKWSIDIGLAYLQILSDQEIITALHSYRKGLEELIQGYHNLEEYMTGDDCPLNRMQLAARPLILYQAEITWVDTFLKQFHSCDT